MVVVGAVVSVVVGVVVVVVGVVVSVVVSVVSPAVELDVRAGAELEVNGVSDVLGSDGASPVMALASPKMISAMMTAPSAPNATSAAGLRYHGVGWS